MTDDQARKLLDALGALREIENEAGVGGFTDPSPLYGSRGPRPVDLGRLAGTAASAANEVFMVLNIAATYTYDPGANRALDEHLGRTSDAAADAAGF